MRSPQPSPEPTAGAAPDLPLQDELQTLVWVQGLAARLCADPSLGDDVSQDVLIAGLDGGPTDPGARRAWLAGAVRRRILMVRRSRGRRAAHEAEASMARAEADSGQAEPGCVMERFETHRQVADAVHRLPEPYRSTVLQRYFEDRTPTEIAELQGVPVGTVKTQLTRGTRKLKEDLERSFGSQDAYLVALLPLARRFAERMAPTVSEGAEPLGGPALGGASGPSGVMQLAVAALVTASGIAALFWVTRGPVPQVAPRASTVPLESVATAGGEDQPARPVVVETETAAHAAREARVVGGASASAPGRNREASQADLVALTVRAVDAAGGAISGAPLERRAVSTTEDEWQEIGRSNASGELVVEVPLEPARIRVQAPGLATAIAGTVLQTGGRQSTLVVASRSGTIEGSVLGANGQGVEGARVTYRARVDLRQLQSDVLASATQPRWETFADGSGAFRFERVPILPGAVLIADDADHGSVEESVVGDGAAYQTLVLGRELAGLRGRVVLPGGEPVEGATVAFHGDATVTGAHGQFVLPSSAIQEGTIRSLHPSHGFGEMSLSGMPTSGEALEITLAHGIVSLRGQVLSGTGEPVNGAVVRTLDRTPLGVVERTAGALTLGSVVQSAESILRQEGDGTAGADGRFTLTLVSGRSYRLAAMDPASMRTGMTAAIDADSHSAIVVIPNAGETRPRTEPAMLRGRVLSAQGVPIADASVQLDVVVGQASAGVTYESLLASGRCVFDGPRVRTDASGGFEFASAAAHPGVRLTAFAGARFGSITLTPEPGELTTFRLPELTTIRVRSVATGSPDATGFALMSPTTGAPLPLYLMQDTTMFSLMSGEIEDGRSPAYRVAVGEYDLVVLQKGREVARKRIRIALAGSTQIIDF